MHLKGWLILKPKASRFLEAIHLPIKTKRRSTVNAVPHGWMNAQYLWTIVRGRIERIEQFAILLFQHFDDSATTARQLEAFRGHDQLVP